MVVARMPARRGIAPLTSIPDRQRRNGFPQPVIRCKHPVIPVPVLPRRRHEIRQPVEKLKRREIDHAVGPRPRAMRRKASRVTESHSSVHGGRAQYRSRCSKG